MVAERTIVVESDGSNNNNQNSMNNNLLDDGSLLLLKMSLQNKEDQNDEEWVKELKSLSIDNDEEVVVIPLGKILEVFGPIFKPLYTVRLLFSSPIGPRTTPSKEQKHQQDSDSDKKDEDKSKNKDQEQLASGANENSTEEKKDNTEKVEKEECEESPQSTSKERDNVETITDPWSEDGVLTKWLQANPKFDIYYATNQVKFVDTQSVVRNSRKGCGTFAFNCLSSQCFHLTFTYLAPF